MAVQHRVPSCHLSSSIGTLKDQAPRNRFAWSSRLKWTAKHHKGQLGSTLSAADYLFRFKRLLNTSSKNYTHCSITFGMGHDRSPHLPTSWLMNWLVRSKRSDAQIRQLHLIESLSSSCLPFNLMILPSGSLSKTCLTQTFPLGNRSRSTVSLKEMAPGCTILKVPLCDASLKRSALRVPL